MTSRKHAFIFALASRESPLILRLREIACGLEFLVDEHLTRELQAMEEWLWRQVEYYNDQTLSYRDPIGRHFETAWRGYAQLLQAVAEMLEYTFDRQVWHLDLGLQLAEQGEATLCDLERRVQEERAWFDRVTPLAVA